MTTTKKEATKTSPKKPRTVKVASLELPKQPLVFEVLDLASKQIVFNWNFYETINSALPPGEVPYSSYDEQTTSSGTLSKKIDLETRRMYETGSFSMGNADQQGRTTIRREAKNFYHFVKGGNDAMNGIRRESMFINLLQGLHPLEAEIVCLCKDKDLESKFKITKEIVSEAYPDIQWG